MTTTFLISAASEFIWHGVALIEWMQADKREYEMPLEVPPIMAIEEATERAPGFYAEVCRARSGMSLLNVIEYHLRKIDPKTFAGRWQEKLLSAYEYPEPNQIESLAHQLIVQARHDPNTTAVLSIMAYALIGLANSEWLENFTKRSAQRRYAICRYCPLTALPPSRYCPIHRTSRIGRAKGTKRKGSTDNLELRRRRAAKISKIAIEIAKDERLPYGRLRRQLLGLTGGLDVRLPPLEDAQDNGFVTGPRIGANGGRWFIYLWHALPRVRAKLGRDWPQLVESALKSREWTSVLERLKKIDPHKKETDASLWVETLIETEEWAEAEEIEQQQQRWRGRPRREKSDPVIRNALAQIQNGKPLMEIAERLEVSVSTLHRWKNLPD